MFLKKIKELKQTKKELENSCELLEDAIDWWKAENKNKDMKIAELEYRLKLADKEKIELNNVITKWMEDYKKATLKNIELTKKSKEVKKVRKAKKVEVIESDETK